MVLEAKFEAESIYLVSVARNHMFLRPRPFWKVLKPFGMMLGLFGDRSGIVVGWF